MLDDHLIRQIGKEQLAADFPVWRTSLMRSAGDSGMLG